MARLRDSQRGAIYAWENQVKEKFPHCNDKMDLAECGDLICKVWSDYFPDKIPPTLKDGRGRRHASGSRWTIKLPKWARSKLIVLHEIAHSLQLNQPWHGREFATLLKELWIHYAGVPSLDVWKMAIEQKPRRVHFATAASVSKRVKRAWVVWKEELARLQRLCAEHRTKEPPKY